MSHREVITEAVERTLRDLQWISVLTNFYLAGSTGLAPTLAISDLSTLTFSLENRSIQGGSLERLRNSTPPKS